MLSNPVLWFAAGVLLIGLEVLVPVGAFIFMGVGCLAGWIAALLDLPLTGQILAAVLVCVLSLLVLRRRLPRVFSGFSGGSESSGAPTSALLGQKGVVSADILLDQEGQVSVGGSYWRARSEDNLLEGESVTVTGVDPDDALLLIVRGERRG